MKEADILTGTSTLISGANISLRHIGLRHERVKDHEGLLRLEEAIVDIDEQFQKQLPLEKAENREMLLTILPNVQYKRRQGLAFLGNSEEGKFDQLVQLNAKIDPQVSKWLGTKRNKYVHGDY